MDRDQAVGILVDIVKPALVRNELELTVDPVAPAVVFALERLAAALFVPRELGCAMPADIVKCPQCAVIPAYDDDGRIADREIFRNVVPRFRDILDAADVEPAGPENGVALALEIRF